MDWQLIETAPKDGTDILLILNCADVWVAHIGWWRSREEWEESGKFCGGWDTIDEWERWWSYTRNSVAQEKLEGSRSPLYWMPLPELPNHP